MRVKPKSVPVNEHQAPNSFGSLIQPLGLRLGPNSDQKKMEERLYTAVTSESAPISSSREEPSFQAGEVAEVLLQLIEENPLNARVFYSNAEIDEIALSLQQNGQDVPARGYVEKGRVILIDGQKRLRGARAAGLKTLRVEVVQKPETEIAQYFESRRINVERSTQTALDDAIRFRKLIDSNLIASQAELARAVKLSETTISQILSINAIPKRVLMHMKERPETCGVSIAYLISQIFVRGESSGVEPEKLEQMALEVVDQVVDYHLSVKQVQALISSRLAGPRTRAKSESEVVSYGGAKGTLKVFEQKRQIDFSIKGLSEEKYNELKNRLREIFEA